MAKLVRDNIPEIIEQQGRTAVTRIAENNAEYWHFLFVKLHEEIVEFAYDPNVEELADITEVVLALGEFWGISEASIQKARLKKKLEKGGFEKKIILEEIKENVK